MKYKAQLKVTDNSTVYRKLMREQLRCPFCPPNQYDNAGMWGRQIRRSWKKYRKQRWKAA